jgi:hypothetical protein
MSSTTIPEPRRPKLKPVPEYRSRKAQIRLFIIAAAFMGVVYLITETAKPERWGWFFGLALAPEQAEEAPPEKIDTRLARLPESENALGVVTIADPFRGTLDDAASIDAENPVAVALNDGWSAYYQQSSLDEHDLIAKALKRASEGQGLDEADANAWTELLASIDRFWLGYRENALRSLDMVDPEDPESKPLDAEQKKKWVEVLDQVDAAWKADREVLAKLAQSGEVKLSDDEKDRLRRWQLRWERFSLAAIKDDTVHRPAEMDAWYRLQDVLNTTSQAELEQQPAINVTFQQLFKESDDYRGKLVRLRGRIMQAKPIKASKNVYGIEQQYMLWIQPEGAPDSPVMVYALGLPEGFPSLDNPQLAGGYTKLREDVEITGYFFKRWAYLGHGGTYTAPLILAKVPHWFPSPDVTRGGDELPSSGTFLLWVAGSALFAILVAALAFARTRATSPALESFKTSDYAKRELEQSLSNAEAGPSPLEALRQLEERDRDKPSC